MLGTPGGSFSNCGSIPINNTARRFGERCAPSNRVMVGWTDPEGGRSWLGSLLLAYYDDDGRLVYAGRAGSGFSQTELQRVWRRLQPLAVKETPLDVLPPRGSRFGAEPRPLGSACTR